MGGFPLHGCLVTQELDDYHRLDWVLRWQLAQAWQLQLSVDNVLDETTKPQWALAPRSGKFAWV